MPRRSPDLKYEANAEHPDTSPRTAKSPASPRTRAATSSCTRAPVTPIATLGDERTFYHGGSRLFQFDPSGKFVKEIGQGTYGFDFAQQVRIDPQDNIWAVDAGSNVLTKFDVGWDGS